MPNTKATGVAYLDPEFTTCFASEELGYSADAQGTVTQSTSKSTAVTLNKSAGQITMNNAALAGTTNVTFTLNNSTISTKDVVILSVASGATTGSYNCWVSGKGTGTCSITVRNITGGSLSEAIVINFAIIHCL
jgi:hypothetical protein